MKRSVFVVEGQTERIFIEKFITELAQGLSYVIDPIECKSDSWMRIKSKACVAGEFDFYIQIIDVGSDEKVRSYVDENAENFRRKFYSNIYGLRDKYTGSASKKEVNILKSQKVDNELKEIWGGNIEVIIAEQETEAWFLAVPDFFKVYDASLSIIKINEILGYDLNAKNVELIAHPAQEITKVLKAVNKKYRKREKDAHKIANILNYSELYIEKSKNIYALNRLCISLNSALSPLKF